MHKEHLSISLEDFVGGERFNEVIVQVAAVRTLLDVAVLGEILHPDSNVHHWLPAVLTVETSLGTHGMGGLVSGTISGHGCGDKIKSTQRFTGWRLYDLSSPSHSV